MQTDSDWKRLGFEFGVRVKKSGEIRPQGLFLVRGHGTMALFQERGKDECKFLTLLDD